MSAKIWVAWHVRSSALARTSRQNRMDPVRPTGGSNWLADSDRQSAPRDVA